MAFVASEEHAAVAIETTSGQPVTCSLTTHSLDCTGETDMVPESTMVERIDYPRGTAMPLSARPTRALYKVTAVCDMKGVDAALDAGTDADHDDRGVDALLRACGMSVTKAAGTRTYGLQTLSDTTAETCTFEMTRGPRWLRAAGCAGTFKLDASADLARWTFDLNGHYSEPVEDAIGGTAAYQVVAPPSFLRGVMTIGSVDASDLLVSSVVFDAGNTVASRSEGFVGPKQVANYLVVNVSDDNPGSSSGNTSYTTASNNATANDVSPLGTPAANQAMYLASRIPFNGAKIKLGTAGAGTWTVTWQYPTAADGSTWATLPMGRQQLVHFRETAGTYYNEWDIPSDWQQISLHDGTAAYTVYCVRAKITAFTSQTVAPLVDQIWTLIPSHGHHSFRVVRRNPRLSCVIESVDPDTYDPVRDMYSDTKRTITVPFGAADNSTWVLTMTNGFVAEHPQMVKENELQRLRLVFGCTSYEWLLT
jgi:hypothetical protein